MGEGVFGFEFLILLALDVFHQAGRFGIEAFMGLGGDLALGFQPCQRDAGLSELGGGNAFSFAQGIESFTGLNALAFPHRVFACLFLNRAAGLVQLRASRIAGEFGLMPAQVRDQGVEGVDLFRQALVFAGLGGLALEAGELALDFSGDFRQALQIGLGAVQLQLGFVTARIEACNAGRFLKDTAAVLRLGADQFRNLTLAYESREFAPVEASANRSWMSLPRTVRPFSL